MVIKKIPKRQFLTQTHFMQNDLSCWSLTKNVSSIGLSHQDIILLQISALASVVILKSTSSRSWCSQYFSTDYIHDDLNLVRLLTFLMSFSDYIFVLRIKSVVISMAQEIVSQVSFPSFSSMLNVFKCCIDVYSLILETQLPFHLLI